MFKKNVRRCAAVVSCARAVVEQLEKRALLAANPIVAENQLPGTPESQWQVSGAGDQTIQGFATDISANLGQTVSFKINDTANAPYHIDIYRMGYYQGNGARLVATVPSTQTQAVVQPAPLNDISTGLIDCGNWSVTASWQVPTNAVSGIYFGRVVRQDTGGASLIVFVVRNDASHSNLLFQTSDTTWEAYNTYGGNSLYGTPQAHDLSQRAYAVSYNRPLEIDATSGGYGDYNSPFHAEYPMVRWLEKNGYDVSYFTDVDAARLGASYIEQHKVYMSVGHDEYWSNQQGANVMAARDAGVNLAFFSGNEHFWKTRWGSSIDPGSTPYRTMICYKESYAPPLDPTDPTNWTGTWRDPRQPNGSNAENALTGTIYMNDRTNVDIGISMNVPSADGNLRFWRDTAVAQLQAGQAATLGDRIVGYEVDEDLDNGLRPAGLMDMSTTTFTTTSHVLVPWGTEVGPGMGNHSITLYRASSGALVFGAGTVQWAWGLDGDHNDGAGSADPSIEQATVNLFADMGVQPASLQPGLKQESMSIDTTAPTSVITAPLAGANLTTGSLVTITGTAVDAGGGVVAGVEVSTDGGQTWHPATGRSNWSYSWNPVVPGPVTILSRAVDDSGNLETPGPGVSVTVHVAATSAAGLVAEYNFDQGAGSALTDLSGHGNNGTLSNATWVTNGRYGSALSFNGTNSIVTIANSPSLQLTTGMTIEAWVSPSALNGWGAVVYKPRSASGLSYALYDTDGTSRPPSGYVNVGQVEDSGAVGRSLVPTNAWSHLAATYDGSNLDLYVNDVLVSTVSASGPIVSSTNALTIGNDNIGETFQGLIDDVRIYNRPLNAAEIGYDMSTPIGRSAETIPPTVSVSASASGASVSGVTTVAANASDDVAVVGVQFLLNGQPIGIEDTTAPYTTSIDTRKLANGSYTLAARARDAAGNFSTSSGITVQVSNPPDTVAPTVSLAGPTAGTTVGGTVVLSTIATDNIGVTGVQFQVNGVNVGPLLTAAPYRFGWNTASFGSGPATITAVAYDAAGNTGTSSVNVTVDATPPTVVSFTPSDKSTNVPTDVAPSVTFDKSVIAGTTTFLIQDSSGNRVSGSLLYDDSTHTVTFFPQGSFSPSTSYTVTVSGTQDTLGNIMTGSVSWSFTTVNSISGATIWSDADVPANSSVADPQAVELGVKFRSSLSGYVTGIRFYKGNLNTGTHVAHLWSSTGTLLATGTFANETASGWQQVNFASSVAISANTTYIASYYAPNGGYADDAGYFTTTGVNSTPLQALANGVDGPNGVYVYGSGGGFPNQSFNSSNYWVDVVFGTTNVIQDTTPPTVTGETPAPNATNVSQNTPVTVTLSESVQPATLTFTLTDPGGNPVTASVTYDDTTHTATLAPTAALAPSSTYTARVSGAKDLAGNTMTGTVVWSFVTGTASTAATTTIWGPTAAPTNPSASDGNAVQLGVKFVSDVNGYVNGIRFYKGAGNTGTHIGNLWSSTGALLATATFVNESASGWQQVQFSSPVPITAGSVYVASYFAPVGRYASDNGYFANSGVDNGTLHALSNAAAGGNGVYAYGNSASFPSNTFNSTNYWVDVVFGNSNVGATAPVVNTQTPVPNATGVMPTTTITAAFNEPIQASTLSFVLTDAAHNVIPAAVSYDATNWVATLTPTSPLAGNSVYTATVNASSTGTDESGSGGVPMSAPATWSFTTAPVVVGASIWSTATVPATPSTNDPNAVELGVRIQSDLSGFITGLRFYKGSLNTGAHVAHLWTATGTLLATANFTNETATGWQQANFSSPVLITAGTTYIASYYAPNGGYSLNTSYFATATDAPPLHALANGANSPNGLFVYGTGGGFPTGTFNSANYWVDVVFSNVLGAVVPTVTGHTPGAAATGVSPTTTVAATFNEPVLSSSIVFALKDPAGNTVPGSLTYDSAGQTVTFTPGVSLAPDTRYTVSLSGASDNSGGVMAPLTWSFTTSKTWVQTTASDFSTDSLTGAVITTNAGGAVQLAPAFSDDFTGTALNSSNWTLNSWTSQGGGTTTVTVSGSVLSVAGAEVLSVPTVTNAGVEGSVSFGATAYQHFGLATDVGSVGGNSWAMFSTLSTTNTLYARVNGNGTTTDVSLGALPAGFHLYRVQPVTGGFQFYVDNVLATTISASLPAGTQLHAMASSFNGSAAPLQADSIRLLTYVPTGTLVSPVINAGATATWGAISWDAVLPAGVTMVVETSSGNTATPDSSWSAWSAATNGGAISSPPAQYIQYRITFMTTDPTLTPTLSDITLTWN